MTYVAVAPHRHAFGVESEADDWRAPPGSPGNCRALRGGGAGIKALYQQIDLGNALATTYRTDAHLVAYVLRGPGGAPLPVQPRINKAGLAFVRSLGFTVSIECLIADVDNPGHCDWTPELLQLAQEQDARLATAGVYYTAHGRRILQPLLRPVDVNRAEGVLAAWLSELHALGIHADPACLDWTRHFRLPHVRRGGADYRSPTVDLSRMRPIPAPAPIAPPRRGRARAAVGPTGDVAGSALAQAFAAAGWLGPSLGQGKAAALCPWRAQHTTGRDYDSSTVLFGPTAARRAGTWFCSHAHCQDRTQDDVVAALPPEARAVLHAAAPPRPDAAPEPRELVAPDVACERLEGAFRRAPPGLSVAIAGCGTGKTEAAITVAGERAATPYATATAQGRRAPAHSKTAISVPTARLAREVADRARAKGIAVRRIFGPLSERDADGAPVCAYHEAAAALARGGLSIPWELCRGRDRNPCDRFETCTAREGAEGPEDARVTIGPHKLLGSLAAEAGSTGLLVIDEPPPLLSHEMIAVEEIATALDAMERYFEREYVDGMRPALAALCDWIEGAPVDQPLVLPELFDNMIVEAARGAIPPDRGSSPLVRGQEIYSTRRSLAHARRIGAAARVGRLVRRALCDPPGHVIARVETPAPTKAAPRPGRVLVLTLPEVALREACRREGATVIADAGGRVHLPIYERIVGYAPPVVEAHAAEGAPVERTWIRARASRSRLAPGRTPDVGVLLPLVRMVVEWALEGGATALAIVSIQAVAQELEAALGAPASPLGAELARLQARPVIGHFGALRGLDAWKGLDALVTLGDPRGPLDAARWEARYLDLDGWESRYQALAAAELEQAHGRLRTVHRTRPARALHVGELLPGGWPSTLAPREPVAHRPRRGTAMSTAELQAEVARAGGTKAAAETWGISDRMVRRYLTGAPVPHPLATLIRSGQR